MDQLTRRSLLGNATLAAAPGKSYFTGVGRRTWGRNSRCIT